MLAGDVVNPYTYIVQTYDDDRLPEAQPRGADAMRNLIHAWWPGQYLFSCGSIIVRVDDAEEGTRSYFDWKRYKLLLYRKHKLHSCPSFGRMSDTGRLRRPTETPVLVYLCIPHSNMN